MKIIICGAGQVGASIARQLASEDIDVTIIDKSEELIRVIGDTLDVRALVGHASLPNVLEQAGAEDAEMIIAVTFSDEVNMVACQVAHSIFNVPTKIARVRNQNYLNPQWRELYGHGHLPIDFIISPEVEVAKAVIRRLEVPGALDMIPFADGKVRMIAVRCPEDAPVINLPVAIIRQKAHGLKINIIGIVRNEQFILPAEDTILSPDDDVYFITDSQDARAAMALFGHEEKEAHRVLIVGGGNIGLFIAEHLESDVNNTRAKLIEVSKDRAEYVSGRLEKTTIIQGSGLDHDILTEVNVANTDTILAVTNDDEVNVLSSLLAKRYGCQRSITLINNATYVPLLSNLGIDAVVNPRETTVSTILQHVRRGKIRSVHTIRDGAAEIIEAEVVETSPLIGKTPVTAELPKEVILGAIFRGKELIIPDRDTVFHQHDRIILLATGKAVKKVEKYFSVSLEFF